MLRICGIIATVLTLLLTFLIFSRIRMFSSTGRLFNTMDPHPSVLTTAQSESRWFTPSTREEVLAEQIDPAFGYAPNGNIILNIYVLLPSLPQECDVTVSRRWVKVAGKFFESTELQHGGKTYSIDRSPITFFTTLALLSLVPILLWALGALVSLAIGSRTHKAVSQR